MQLKVAILLSALVAEAVCYDNTTIGDLPSGVVSELLGVIKNTAMEMRGGCENPHESDFTLWLYTRNNRNLPIALNQTNPIEIDPTKNVILLIHGWVSNPSLFVPEMKDAYLERYDCNVILVDWSRLALQLFSQAVCFLPKVSQLVAKFLCRLDKEFNVPVKSIHLVGHSLGGQMSGFIGQSTFDQCGKQVGRITGLDPAGPSFQNLPKSQRLDQSDAIFVDVIHTNGGYFGYLDNCGHADFYVNCGTIQLGCPAFTFTADTIRNLPVTLVACHHMRSVNYMTESISNSNSFHAKMCKTCPFPCILNFLLLTQTEIVMGEHCPESARGGYVLDTNLDSPYGGGLKNLIPRTPLFKNLFEN